MSTSHAAKIKSVHIVAQVGVRVTPTAVIHTILVWAIYCFREFEFYCYVGGLGLRLLLDPTILFFRIDVRYMSRNTLRKGTFCLG